MQMKTEQPGADRPPAILVVDDDRLVLATLSQGLRDAGYEVIEAASGEEALRLCAERRPDIALLDTRMPGLSGIDVARELRGMEIPFLFLSAYGDDAVVRAAVEQGALSYLVKPVDVPQIVPAIQAALVRGAEAGQMRANERHLTTALASGREISVAIGLLMDRLHLTEEQAFDALRTHGRAQRRRVAELAAELVDAAERLNTLLRAVAQSVGKNSGKG